MVRVCADRGALILSASGSSCSSITIVEVASDGPLGDSRLACLGVGGNSLGLTDSTLLL